MASNLKRYQAVVAFRCETVVEQVIKAVNTAHAVQVIERLSKRPVFQIACVALEWPHDEEPTIIHYKQNWLHAGRRFEVPRG